MDAVVDTLAELALTVGPSPGDEKLRVTCWLPWHLTAYHETVLFRYNAVAIVIHDICTHARIGVAPESTRVNPVD